jgi:hypothetical protein
MTQVTSAVYVLFRQGRGSIGCRGTAYLGGKTPRVLTADDIRTLLDAG